MTSAVPTKTGCCCGSRSDLVAKATTRITKQALTWRPRHATRLSCWLLVALVVVVLQVWLHLSICFVAFLFHLYLGFVHSGAFTIAPRCVTPPVACYENRFLQRYFVHNHATYCIWPWHWMRPWFYCVLLLQRSKQPQQQQSLPNCNELSVGCGTFFSGSWWLYKQFVVCAINWLVLLVGIFYIYGIWFTNATCCRGYTNCNIKQIIII